MFPYSYQEQTIEVMLKLRDALKEDIGIQRELMKHQLMEGKTFSTRSTYTEECIHEDDIDMNNDDIRILRHDEDILEVETQLLKDLLSQINEDYCALKLEEESSQVNGDDCNLEDSLRSSEESFVDGKQLYRDIITGMMIKWKMLKVD